MNGAIKRSGASAPASPTMAGTSVINVSQGTDTRNRVFYKDLRDPQSKSSKLLNDFDASYNFIDNDGPVFWFHTDLNSPRGRVIAVDTRKT
jgi:prolyl oligopeptidase